MASVCRFSPAWGWRGHFSQPVQARSRPCVLRCIRCLQRRRAWASPGHGRGPRRRSGAARVRRARRRSRPASPPSASRPRAKAWSTKCVRTEKLLAREGYKRGIDKQRSTQLAIDRVVAQGLENQVNGSIGNITQGDIEAYYNAHPDSFHMPARTRIQVIFLAAPASDAKKREQAHDTATGLLQQLRENTSSSDRTARPTDDIPPTCSAPSPASTRTMRAHGWRGRSGFLTDAEMAQKYAPELVPAVQALKFDDPDALVEAPAGFYIVKLIPRAPAKDDSPDDAATATLIRNRLDCGAAAAESATCSPRCARRATWSSTRRRSPGFNHRRRPR